MYLHNALPKRILLVIGLVKQEMVYTEYTKKRILHYNECNFSTSEIVKALEKEGIKVSRAGHGSF